MTARTRASAALVVAAALAAPALAGVAWDEAIHGDLSTNPAAPSPIALALGSNTVAGTMGSPSDTRDVFTFTIAPGRAFTAIFLLDYRDVSTGGLGNTGYIHIDNGTSTVVPAPATILDFLGGSHLDRTLFPTNTDNVLAAMAGAPAGGVGFALPLGPGDYTINVQQTGPQLTAYTLDLIVVPAPSTLVAVLLATALPHRRRR